MPIQNYGSIEIFGVKTDKLSEDRLLERIDNSISGKKKLTIAYANADSLNKIYIDENLKKIYNSFDIIHPDGIGVYLASKILYGKEGFEQRLTGSDFYLKLTEVSDKKGWSYFFFGHRKEILENIRIKNPSMKITGIEEGYNYDSNKVVERINELKPDIIITGLSCPVQEKWIFEQREKINSGVLFAVGDGIKVFSGKKVRGPEFMRIIGMEWFVRFLSNPFRYFKKYIIGNPLFIYRIIKESFKKS